MSFSIGGDDEAIDRQPHPFGVVAGQHVAEIAGRNGEGYRPLRRPESDRADEIVNNLRQDAGPIDGIDARQAHFVAEGEIAEQVLDDPLAVVEIALDRQRMDVRLTDRRHLPALDVGYPSPRKEDEDLNLGLVGERLDCRCSGIARRRADDCRPRAALPQHPIHRLAQPLHGEVLERQRRTVEKLEREQVVINLHNGRGRRVPEAGICSDGQSLDFVRAEVSADEGGHDPHGRFRVRQSSQRPDGVRPPLGQRERHVEAAVTGETCEHRVCEAEGRRRAARRNIAHE